MPITAMVACLSLLSANAQICVDADQHMYLCIDGKCRTPQKAAADWKKSPQQKLADYMKIYGYEASK